MTDWLTGVMYMNDVCRYSTSHSVFFFMDYYHCSTPPANFVIISIIIFVNSITVSVGITFVFSSVVIEISRSRSGRNNSFILGCLAIAVILLLSSHNHTNCPIHT